MTGLVCDGCKVPIDFDELTFGIDWMPQRFLRDHTIDVKMSTSLMTLCASCGDEVRLDIEAALHAVLAAKAAP